MTGESIYLKRHKTIPIGVLWMGVSTSDAGANDELIDTDIPVAYIANIWRDERLFIYAGEGAGQTRKIEAYNAGTFTLYDDWVTNPDKTSRYQVISGEGISGGAAVGDIMHEVGDVVIYPAAEDRGTAELDGNGTSPNYLAESQQSHGAEAAAQNDPAWEEDIDFEQNGASTVISIYAELHWAQKKDGGTNSVVKMQISGDGGGSWVDLTDNVTEAGTVYVDKTRAGAGRWITAITAGANQLQLRLCQWVTGGGNFSYVKLREDSYIRISYRKS